MQLSFKCSYYIDLEGGKIDHYNKIALEFLQTHNAT